MYCEMQPRGRKTLVVRHRIPLTSILVVGPRPYSMINIPSQRNEILSGKISLSLIPCTLSTASLVIVMFSL